MLGKQNSFYSSSLGSLNNYVNSFKNAVGDYQAAANALNNTKVNPPPLQQPQPTRGGGGGVHYQAYYAEGTTDAKGGLSIVGENGPEMRVLNKGDGIIPSDITKNLWEWGSLSPAQALSGVSGISTQIGKNISIVIDTFAPNLSSVRNGEEFADYMKNNFWRQVMQYKTV